jgi:hypothetical protein
VLNIIISVIVLYGCEFWCRTLREEHKLIALGNRINRKIFGPKRVSNRKLGATA